VSSVLGASADALGREWGRAGLEVKYKDAATQTPKPATRGSSTIEILVFFVDCIGISPRGEPWTSNANALVVDARLAE
jgi:hypothetical protein